MRLIDADKLIKDIKELWDYKTVDGITATTVLKQTITDIENQPTVKAISIEWLISILPKYDDYIHMKTYPHNETMEYIYSKGHEEGWNVCLKIIKDELEDWEKENDS